MKPFLFALSLALQAPNGVRVPGAANVLECVPTVADHGGSGCLRASSTATFGKLWTYPGQDNGFMSPAVVSGGRFNSAMGSYGTVGGGSSNAASGSSSTVGGGVLNASAGNSSTVAGGNSNSASGFLSTVGGGRANVASGFASNVAGGSFNEATTFSTSVGGGFSNLASGSYGVVGGGLMNSASGAYSTVPGGRSNWAAGVHSVAVGRRAQALHDGAFVWGDSFDADKCSSAADEFSVFAGGGTRVFSASDGSVGVTLAPGAGSWTTVSDREAKENLQAVDAADAGDLLDKLASLPISTWNYKAQGASVRHMGPMAQDFHAAFGLGVDERGIDTTDADGVALAGVQGLYRIVRGVQAENASLRAELAALRARVASLESIDDPRGAGGAGPSSVGRASYNPARTPRLPRVAGTGLAAPRAATE